MQNQIGKSIYQNDNDYIFDKVGIMLHGTHSFCTKLTKVIKVTSYNLQIRYIIGISMLQVNIVLAWDSMYNFLVVSSVPHSVNHNYNYFHTYKISSF